MTKLERMEPSITFGIPVLNEERYIERCLQSIKSQDYPAEKIEVIVADSSTIANDD